MDVAIVDYGVGNLFSILRACEHVGLSAQVTSEASIVATAPAVILPGVGAFGDAAKELHRLNMVDAISHVANVGRPLWGICLGMQLLLEVSEEFGLHKGLGLIPGRVVHFDPERARGIKVPHIGWASISVPGGRNWAGTLFEGLRPDASMYFVHSYYAEPADLAAVATVSSFYGREFCSSVTVGNVLGCQFHPERSGRDGLKIYENFARMIKGDHSPKEVS